MELKTTVLATALIATFIVTSSLAFAQPAPNGAHARAARQVFIRTPRGSCGPPDYISVPRYCYDPRDDRVDTSPYAKPVAPVYGLVYGRP